MLMLLRKQKLSQKNSHNPCLHCMQLVFQKLFQVNTRNIVNEAYVKLNKLLKLCSIICSTCNEFKKLKKTESHQN